MDRRTVIGGLLAAIALPRLTVAPQAAVVADDSVTTVTLEAFADTLIPGAKRFPGDVAVAGAAAGPGGADVGYLQLLRDSRVKLCWALPELAVVLNMAAAAYAAGRLILLPWGVPPMAGLTFAQRTAFLPSLFRTSRSDRLIWILLAVLASIAFDSAAHLQTAEAIRNGHPGLKFLRFPPPNADGRWRFERFSYGRQLAAAHPGTTTGGSPS
ncbi:DUF5987 family protein [Kribbella ginsengisoli]|uniref:DUF5987 family protein n=1 Tax=Kribbella ginsengisoli TaxID=363865 RepID=A0ABP6Z7Z8_9ACTN